MMSLCLATTMMVGQVLWAKTYGGTSMDIATSITQTSDGGFALAGYTQGFGFLYDEFLVFRLDSMGNISWVRTFGGSSYDRGWSITQTTDGGFAVAGRTRSFGAGGEDVLVLKLNSSGSLSWARTFGGAGTDYAWSIAQTADGGFAIAEVTTGFGMGGNEALVVRLNELGDLSWARTFGHTDWDFAYSIIRTMDGGFAIAGLTHSFGADASDLFFVKTDASVWLSGARTFGLPIYDGAFSIIQIAGGGFAAVGYLWRPGVDYDIVVIKMDPDMNYPGCLQGCNPAVTTPSPLSSSPMVITNSPTPTVTTPTLNTTTPTLTITDVCEPLYVEEAGSGALHRITCSPIPGGLLFLSLEAMSIRIYAADGRLAYSGNIGKGKNRIPLDAGAYLWMAGDAGAGHCAYPVYKGKAIVR